MPRHRSRLQLAFGANLRRVRRERGISQEALAEFLQVHRTYIGGLERGERNPSLMVVERLAQQLGIDPLTLLREPVAADVVSAAVGHRRAGTDPSSGMPNTSQPA